MECRRSFCNRLDNKKYTGSVRIRILEKIKYRIFSHPGFSETQEIRNLPGSGSLWKNNMGSFRIRISSAKKIQNLSGTALKNNGSLYFLLLIGDIPHFLFNPDQNWTKNNTGSFQIRILAKKMVTFQIWI